MCGHFTAALQCYPFKIALRLAAVFLCMAAWLLQQQGLANYTTLFSQHPCKLYSCIHIRTSCSAAFTANPQCTWLRCCVAAGGAALLCDHPYWLLAGQLRSV
jgi:hypothetical protein